MGRALLAIGLGFGDEGKGGIVAHLCQREASRLVCRFNGGAQATHGVVDEDGRDHRFSQFGAGTFAGARTFLSRYMLFNPASLIPEARHLIEIGVPDPYQLLTIDEAALVTTPFHVATNRIRETARSWARHGSCGMGIGETRAYEERYGREALRVGDLKNPDVTRDKLTLMCARLRAEVEPLIPAHPGAANEWEILTDFDLTMTAFQPSIDRVVKYVEIVSSDWLHYELGKNQTVVFEGAQGALLDENHGFHPHTTWSTTSFDWADVLVEEARQAGHQVTVERLGILRGYMTRHGHGPFVTEDPTIPIPKNEHNCLGPWQATFRRGHFDGVMARYALDLVGRVDGLALTCLDHLKGPVKSSWSYKDSVGSDFNRLPFKRYPPGSDLQSHLQRQNTLTQLLSGNVKPIYQESTDVDSFVSHVEQALDVPVKILSFGPKASDKHVR